MNTKFLSSNLMRVLVIASLVIQLTMSAIPPAKASTNTTLVGWGYNGYGEANNPEGLTDVVAISAGLMHSLALKNDGTLVAWGYNNFGVNNVPAGLTGVVAISSGFYDRNLALKSDGTVVVWGLNAYGEGIVPDGLSDVIAIDAGAYHNLALKSDGTVVAWGQNIYGQSNVPTGLSDVIAIAAGGYHNLALKSDHTVVAWGSNSDGQSSVPAGLSDVIAISAGAFHNLALKSDGTVVAWGRNNYGQINVPTGLSGVTAIEAGPVNNLVLKSDHTVVAWGDNFWGQADVPAGLSDVTLIAVGMQHSLVLGHLNRAPVAQGQSVTTDEDTAFNITLAATDVDIDPLSYSIIDQPQHGTLSGTPPNVTYTPTGGYYGSDSFTFKANDGWADSNVATVSITVEAVNDVPLAVNDAYSTDEDTALMTAAPGVLSNDTDADLDPLSAVLVSGPTHGTLALNTDGSFSYTPAADYSGSDTFSYKANDSALDSNVATVSITVNAVNDAPVAVNDVYSVDEDEVLAIAAPGVLSNDTDADLDLLSAVLVSGPAHGTLVLNANGSFSYTPAADYVGTDSFTYKANDGLQDSNIATESITVIQTNTAPTANPGGPYLGAVNTNINFDGSLSSDPESDPLTYAWDFGDGSATGTGTAPTHSYAAAGVYNVCLTVDDGELSSVQVCTLAVVYDPSNGFVTGGGWINSPAGAYKADLTLAGQATFGFVARYQKGASVPSGNTAFEFDLAGLSFASQSYDWLVVNQAGTNAQFKGSGLINGLPDPNGNAYRFMLWAGDGSPDTFHIRIWWEDSAGEHDVYDNGTAQAIGAGNIVVHTGK